MCVKPSNSEKALWSRSLWENLSHPGNHPFIRQTKRGGWGTLHSVLGAGDLYMVPATTSLGPLQSTKAGFHYHTMVLMLLEAGTANYCLQSKPPTLFQGTLQPCGRVGRQTHLPPSMDKEIEALSGEGNHPSHLVSSPRPHQGLRGQPTVPTQTHQRAGFIPHLRLSSSSLPTLNS